MKFLVLSLSLFSFLAFAEAPKNFSTKEADYNKAIKNGEKVLVVFSASWCGPCRQMAKDTWNSDTFQNEAKTKGIKLFYFDIDKHRQLAQANRISSVPVYMIKNSIDKDGKINKNAIVSVGQKPQSIVMSALATSFPSKPLKLENRKSEAVEYKIVMNNGKEYGPYKAEAGKVYTLDGFKKFGKFSIKEITKDGEIKHEVSESKRAVFKEELKAEEKVSKNVFDGNRNPEGPAANLQDPSQGSQEGAGSTQG